MAASLLHNIPRSRTFLKLSEIQIWTNGNRRAIGKITQTAEVPLYKRYSSIISSPAAKGPLTGLRVLDLSRVLAGPFCTQILADYGASVLKIEQPHIGDETRQWRARGESEMWKDEHPLMSLYFASINRNKRSMTLDLKSPDGVAIVRRLVQESDVLIHNFVPGKIEKIGLEYDELKDINPKLIYASVSGYGATGPDKTRAGYDAIALAEAGLLHITGDSEGPPTKPGVAIADMCTGLYTHGAILAALAQRERTGVGVKIEGSLFESGLSMLINVGLTALNLDANGSSQQRRRGTRHGLEHPSLVPYGGFKTGDDKIMFIAANNNRQWRLLCEKMQLRDLFEDESLSTNDGRVENRQKINTRISTELRRKTRSEWMKTFDGSGLPYGSVNDVVEALESPQANAREMTVEIDNFEAAREGLLKLIAPAIKIQGVEMKVRRKPPLLGEHTEEVLGELGYQPGEIVDLKSRGIV